MEVAAPTFVCLVKMVVPSAFVLQGSPSSTIEELVAAHLHVTKRISRANPPLLVITAFPRTGFVMAKWTALMAVTRLIVRSVDTTSFSARMAPV
jgi:hypothetical protein